MPDFSYIKTKDGGFRFAITALILIATIIAILGPGSKSPVILYLVICIIASALTSLVLLRHLNDDLTSPLFNLPWKKAEIFIYYGCGAIGIFGCVICWINSDSGLMSFAAIGVLVASVLELLVATQVNGLPNDVLVRSDKVGQDEDEKKSKNSKKSSSKGSKKSNQSGNQSGSANNAFDPEALDKTKTLESHITVDSVAGLIKSTPDSKSGSSNRSTNSANKQSNAGHHRNMNPNMGGPAGPGGASQRPSISSSMANSGENKEIFDQLHGQHITNGEQNIYSNEQMGPGPGRASSRLSTIGPVGVGVGNNNQSTNRRHMRYTNTSIHSQNQNTLPGINNGVESVLNRQPLSHLSHHSSTALRTDTGASVRNQLRLSDAGMSSFYDQ